MKDVRVVRSEIKSVTVASCCLSLHVPLDLFVMYISLTPSNMNILHYTVKPSLNLAVTLFEGVFAASESSSIHVGLSLGLHIFPSL